MQLVLLAATLASAKVLLATLGVTLFLAERGSAALPAFYVGFAPVAIALSFGLGAIIDRWDTIRLAQVLFAGSLLLAAACHPLLEQGVPGVLFGLFAAAFVFEILIDIVLWLVVAVHLDALTYKRAISFLYLGLALGGAAGGGLARLGMKVGGPADLLPWLMAFALLAVVQLEVAGRTIRRPSVSRHDHDPAEAASGPRPSPLRRHPLALLIAASALFVTLLFGLSEFLIFRIYENAFTSAAELGRTLSLVFAANQLIEFGLLFTLSRLLLERANSLLRNLVFPLSSLLTLLHLAFAPRLPAAIALQINTEAVCNAIFLPVNNANYMAVPLGVQGRARTLADGICYPAGLALAGLLLMVMESAPGLAAVEFSALVVTLAFLLVAVAIGTQFLPSLVQNARMGVTPLRRIPGGRIALPREAVARVRALLDDARPERQLLGLARARWLGVRHVTPELIGLAARADPRVRRELVRLALNATPAWTGRFARACFARGGTASLIALRLVLTDRSIGRVEELARASREGAAEGQVLGHLLHWRRLTPRARAEFMALVRQPEIAAMVVETIVDGGRTELLEALGACLAAAPANHQRDALEFLADRDLELTPALADVVQSARHGPDPALRAAALALIARRQDPYSAIFELVRALQDPNERVRRRAADLLSAHGDQAVEALRPWLEEIRPGSREAACALQRIGTPRARAVLATSLQKLHGEAERVLHLQCLLERQGGPARKEALASSLGDYAMRLGGVATGVLASSLTPIATSFVQEALGSADPHARTRARDLLAALTPARGTADAIGILRLQLAAEGNRPPPGSRLDVAPDAAFALAGELRDPWVRRAAGRQGSDSRPAGTGEERMQIRDRDLERALVLKRLPPFDGLPLETLVSVARGARVRTYRAGEAIGGPELMASCHLLEAGSLQITHQGEVRTLGAPALFNELALVGQAVPHVEVVAREPARISSVHRILFQDLCRDHPELLMALSRHLAKRLQASGHF